ncbi:MAG: c-type cytochrome biogenesis protein CcmI, partial [Spongiibacteraceae bacterium]
MIELYVGLIGLLLLALLFLRFSLRSQSPGDSVGEVPRREAQREFYRQRSAELLSDHQHGLLDEVQFQELTLELERQLIAEAGDDVSAVSAINRPYWIPVALLILPLVVFLYQQLAHRQDLELLAIQADFQHAESVG